jgi:hypothetical protein
MNWQLTTGIAVVIIAILGFAYLMMGSVPALVGDYRDFYVNRGLGDIGEVSTFDGVDCEPAEGEVCVILNAHWENINPTSMLGTYILRCRCYDGG